MYNFYTTFVLWRIEQIVFKLQLIEIFDVNQDDLLKPTLIMAERQLHVNFS